jgi:hypothetical protein
MERRAGQRDSSPPTPLLCGGEGRRRWAAVVAGAEGRQSRIRCRGHPLVVPPLPRTGEGPGVRATRCPTARSCIPHPPLPRIAARAGHGASRGQRDASPPTPLLCGGEGRRRWAAGVAVAEGRQSRVRPAGPPVPPPRRLPSPAHGRGAGGEGCSLAGGPVVYPTPTGAAHCRPCRRWSAARPTRFLTPDPSPPQRRGETTVGGGGGGRGGSSEPHSLPGPPPRRPPSPAHGRGAGGEGNSLPDGPVVYPTPTVAAHRRPCRRWSSAWPTRFLTPDPSPLRV